MKRNILIAAVLVFTFHLSPLTLHAQHPEDGVAHHTVKFNLLSPLVSSFDFNYEYRISHRMAAACDLGGIVYNSAFNTLIFGITIPTKAIFLQPQFRFYLCDQRRLGAMPFIGAGLNCTVAWSTINSFTGNDGWDVHTVSYNVHDWALRPAIAFGVKFNIPFGLTIEETIGIIIPTYDFSASRNALLNDSDPFNYATTQCSIRLGWAF